MRRVEQLLGVVKKCPRVAGWFTYHPFRVYGQPRFALGCQYVEVVEVAVQHGQLRLGGYEYGEERLSPLDQGRGQGTGPFLEVAPQSLHTPRPLGDGRERVVRWYGTPQLLQHARGRRRGLLASSRTLVSGTPGSRRSKSIAPRSRSSSSNRAAPCPPQSRSASASALKSEFGKESFRTVAVPSAWRAGAT